ncbi:hypothetical protein WJX84_009213 [Apatococcus fuscideae]|uniref:Uncharacterized protein n=1 Tax=Apatococcus fuscideae TaxID=2026836 RepID=A0AAW1SSW3_9CHLO
MARRRYCFGANWAYPRAGRHFSRHGSNLGPGETNLGALRPRRVDEVCKISWRSQQTCVTLLRQPRLKVVAFPDLDCTETTTCLGAAPKPQEEIKCVEVDAFASVHDMIHAAIHRTGASATLREIYRACEARGRIAYKRSGGSRLITQNDHWKSQIPACPVHMRALCQVSR